MPPHTASEPHATSNKQAPRQSLLREIIRRVLNNVKAGSMSPFKIWPEIPEGLYDAEKKVYQTLLKTLKNRTTNGQPPPHLVVITDLAKDYDDLMAMVLLCELHRLGLVELEAFVANLVPADERARFGRGALDELGLQKIPIGIGSHGTDNPRDVKDHEFNHCEFMTQLDPADFKTGEVLLQQVLEKAQDEKRKITLVLLSSLMDISQFSNNHLNLIKDTVNNISIQGGMYTEGGILKADSLAANNKFSSEDAKNFTRVIQDNNISTIVFTKVAAFATKIYSEFFAELEDTRHPLGIHLRKTQLAQDIAFYKDTMDEKTRFRPFMTQHWFLTNKSTWFTKGHSEDSNVEPYPLPDNVPPFLTVVVAYDALAALGGAGIDLLTDLDVLRPAVSSPAAGNSFCRVVGITSSTNTPNVVEDPGVKGDRMATAIKALVRGALLASQQHLT